jgi:hypothetical protein
MKHIFPRIALFLTLSPLAAYGFGNMSPPVQGASSSATNAPAMQEAAQQPPSQAPNVSGRVVQTIDSGGYSYVLLKKKDDSKIWVAAPAMKVSVGEQVTFEGGMEMINFPSSTLKRTFDKVIFSNGIVKDAKTKDVKDKDAKKDARSPGSMGAAVAVTDEKIKVKKATGTNAYSIAEIFKKKDKLNKKPVTVNGKVVKVSSGIMNRNWIHIQDGTGNHATANNDLVVTSDAIPLVGDTITVQGTLFTNKDFGGGYKYNVIIEKAKITIK